MGLSVFINNKSLNLRFSDALAQYDTDNNGFTRQEFSDALDGVASVFARYIIKLTKCDKSLFDEINTDKNNIMSYKEIANYIEKEYHLDLNTLYPMTLKEICTLVDNMDNKDKKE